MDAEFWHERWREGRIRFHQGQPNGLMLKHWPQLVAQPAGDVFVPLCGKSLDMTWLAQRGHHVIGVELSDIAVRDYFQEHGLTPDVRREGDFEVLSAGRVELWCGDYFAFPKERLVNVVAAYDRASLFALPPELRRRYADTFMDLMPPTARTLLMTFAYDQSEMSGPPFAVHDNEVFDLYGNRLAVNLLETRDALAGAGDLQDRGLSALTVSVFALGPAKLPAGPTISLEQAPE